MPDLSFVDKVADQVTSPPVAPPEPLPPEVLQKFMAGLTQILPGLPPEKAQAIGQLLISAFSQEDALEPETESE